MTMAGDSSETARLQRKATTMAKPIGRRRTTAQVFLKSFVRNRLGVMGLLIVVIMILGAVLGPRLVDYEIDEMDLEHRLEPPGPRHLLGTDSFGRDTLTRLLYAARVSLTVSMLATLVAMSLGVALGAAAGYGGGWADEGIMRLMDIMLAFPYMVLAIVVVGFVGPGFHNLIWILGIIRVPQFARITRSAVLQLKEEEFVIAARAIGRPRLAVLWRHVLPNCLTPISVYASLSAATAITAESGLSFLGLGIQPPMSSWGTMISDGARYLMRAPALTTFPGVAISLTVFGFNLLGDGLRDALDPFSIA
jgi:peptide/nickel transport system permease protein